jgi:hypothetical protein
MPTVVVFFFWPPAEGPGMTGKFEGRDARGNVKRTFTYTIKRAWEFTAEELVHNPATMTLAPLSKGAKERMPAIVQMVKKGLNECKPDAKTRAMVWGAFYWAMGLVCDVEDADRALGDMLPVVQRCGNYLSAKGQAFMGAYSVAQTEGPLSAARALILRQATHRFDEWPGAGEKIAAITSLTDLEALAQRVLTAADWPTLLDKLR